MNPYDPYNQQNPQDPYAQQPPPPKNGARPLLIGVGATAVAAVVVVLLFVTGVFSLGGSSYQRAESNFIQSLFSSATLAGAQGQKVDFQVSYEPPSELRLGVYDIGLIGSVATKDQTTLANLLLSIDGETVSEIEAYANNGEYGLAIPGLSQYYIKVVMSQLLGGSDLGFDMSDLDQQKLQETLSAIGDAYFAMVDPVAETENGVQLSSGNVTVSCTSYTINFTEEMLATFLTDAITEIRKNQNLMDFIGDIMDSSGGMYGQSLDEILDEAYDQLRDYEASDKRLFRMTVWVQRDKVIGRRIDKVRDAEDFQLFYQILENGRETSVEGRVVIPYSATLKLTGSFSMNAGAWDGSAKLIVEPYYGGDTASFRLKSSGVKRDGKQLIGTFQLTGEMDSASLDVNLVFGKQGAKQTLNLTGNFDDGRNRTDFGYLDISYEINPIGNIDLSRFDERFAVIAGDDSDDNIDRARAMLDELEDQYDDGDFDDGVMYAIYSTMRSYVNSILWYADPPSDYDLYW